MKALRLPASAFPIAYVVRSQAPCRPSSASCLAAALLTDPRVSARPGRLFNRPPDLRCLRQHGRIRDLIGSQAIRSVPLPRLLTPAGPVRPRHGGRPGAAPAHRATKAPAFDDFVANLPRLQYPLPTLHECRCLTHARLASGRLARLCREGVQPSGSLPKVSVLLHRLPPSLSFLSRSACIRVSTCFAAANAKPTPRYQREARMRRAGLRAGCPPGNTNPSHDVIPVRDQ